MGCNGTATGRPSVWTDISKSAVTPPELPFVGAQSRCWVDLWTNFSDCCLSWGTMRRRQAASSSYLWKSLEKSLAKPKALKPLMEASFSAVSSGDSTWSHLCWFMFGAMNRHSEEEMSSMIVRVLLHRNHPSWGKVCPLFIKGAAQHFSELWNRKRVGPCAFTNIIPQFIHLNF